MIRQVVKGCQSFGCNFALRRNMASLTISSHGAPATALKYDGAKVNSSASVGETLVSVKASQITVEDIKQVRGLSSKSRTGLGGSSAVGTTPAGDRVLVLDAPCWADSVAAPQSSLFKLANVNLEESACLPSYLTAWAILHSMTGLSKGDTILQNNGDSPVGKAIVQLGKAHGYTVVSVGAAELTDAQGSAALKEKHKAKFAVSGVSGKSTSLLLKSLSGKSIMVVYEGTNEPLSKTSTVDVPISGAIFVGSQILGVNLLTWAKTNPEQVQNAIDSISSLLESKAITLTPSVFPASDFSGAFSAAESNKTAVISF